MTSYKEPMVRRSGNRLITTSLAVSHHFGKKHKHVLEAIKMLDCSKEFNETNFRPVTYQGGNGEQRPAYEITRDGFMFLCMGFTGAAQIAAGRRIRCTDVFGAIRRVAMFDEKAARRALDEAQSVYYCLSHLQKLLLDSGNQEMRAQDYAYTLDFLLNPLGEALGRIEKAHAGAAQSAECSL